MGGAEIYLQGFHSHTALGLKSHLCYFCTLRTAAFSSYCTSYEHEWSQIGLCNSSCFPKLCFKLSEAISNSVFRCLIVWLAE